MIESSANPPGGYHGCYLRIDLSTGDARRVPLPTEVLRQFVGGSGLGTYVLLREGAATAEALSPDSPLAFVFSPLVGSPLTTSAKFAVVSKSPLTQRLNDSLASSGFAIAGKRTGHDALVIVGKAPQPSVLIVDDRSVRIKAAGDLWGETIPQAEASLKQRLDPEFKSAVIGPAGERQVLYATISHDGRHAGRGGAGAVLGSKNIKAVAVRGTRRPAWANGSELVTLARSLSDKSFGPATAKYRELGTASNLLVFNRLHALPTRNFQQGSFDGAEAISPEMLSTTRSRTRAHCAACTIGCEHIYSLSSKSAAGGGVRLEYENLFALGPLCGIDQPDDVLAASRRCDELGLDTISLGGTVAFAMECVQRGYLQADWLRFGEPEALRRAIEMTAMRDGLGDLLANGSRRMAMQLGKEALEIAPQVKGLEMPGYEPRALQTMALGLAVGSRGADHNRSGAYESDFSPSADRRNPGAEAALRAIETEDKAAIMDSLILCKFLRGVLEDYYADCARMLALVTGWDVTAEELRETARRIVAAKKQFNIRAGWQPSEDTLPARFLKDPLPDDPQARLTPERLANLVADYNTRRGWTVEGWIPPDELMRLGLEA